MKLVDNTVGSLTAEQQSILIGCLLGDGTMRKKTNAHLEINHSYKQKFFVDWLYQKFRAFVLTEPKSRKGNGGRVAYRFATRSLPVFTPFYQEFFPRKRKIIPRNLKMTPLALAVWFMADGSKSWRSVYLNTQIFSMVEQKRLMAMLRKQFGIESTLNKDKIYYRIRIGIKSVGKFINLIKPFVLKEFWYKFPSVMTP